jgi:hypothetical protein
MPISTMSGLMAISDESGSVRPRAIRTAATVRGESIWRWLAFAYAAYWIFFIAGAYTGRTALNNVGAVFILAALGWATVERLWVRVDAVAIACIAAATLPLVVALSTDGTRYPDAMVKHISLYIVIAISRILCLPAVSRSSARAFFALQICIVLVLSFFTDANGAWESGTRHSGLFANPNNLALIPLLLLFLPSRRDPRWLQFAAPAAVVAVLAITRTSGSIIACAVGMGAHFFSFLPRRAKPVVAALAATLGLGLAAFVSIGGESLLPESRLTTQIAVMRTDLKSVIDGNPISFYRQERALGSGTASGVWRLEHWRKTLVTYADGTTAQKLVGFGMGSSPDHLGKLPHNDYLRVLFEQGIVGLGLFLFAWFRAIRTAPKDVRYCGLILAIYCFSENNLDNFPFMSLFVLFLSSGRVTENAARKLTVVRPAAMTREEFA